MRPLRDPGESGGIDESTDAWDTIEWLLKNVPHQNGRVGMRGNSYAGLYALMGALSRHPALVAVSPQAPPIDWFRGDDMHTNGALNLLMAVNWLRTNGVVREGPDEKEVPPVLDLGCPDLFTFFRQAGPLSTWNARYFKDRVPFWNDLMTHTTYDAFWKARNVLPHLSNLSAAVLMVGGWFDAEDPYGPVAAYSEIERRQPGKLFHSRHGSLVPRRLDPFGRGAAGRRRRGQLRGRQVLSARSRAGLLRPPSPGSEVARAARSARVRHGDRDVAVTRRLAARRRSSDGVLLPWQRAPGHRRADRRGRLRRVPERPRQARPLQSLDRT
ncbi:MAG: CocE/NonD family hydrolase [Holophagales bacterium]|nr:CocE/NonD family hydrolase [Holophagales bacterium]